MGRAILLRARQTRIYATGLTLHGATNEGDGVLHPVLAAVHPPARVTLLACRSTMRCASWPGEGSDDEREEFTPPLAVTMSGYYALSQDSL